MKAVIFEKFGDAGVLRLSDVARPVAGAGQVVIRVKAVSLNPSLDFAVRSGGYSKPVTLPHVLGVDPSGEIAEIGPGVTGFAVGQRVSTTPWLASSTSAASSSMLGVQAWGGCAEYVLVPAAQVHPLPDSVDFATATVVLRHAPLAMRLVLDTAQIKAGNWLLVTGATGGLGHMAVQVARLAGARVIAAVRSQQSCDWLTSIGVDVVVDYSRQSLVDEVERATAGAGVDAAIETTGKPEHFAAAFQSLARFGRLVTSGGPAAGAAAIDVKRLYLRQLSILGRTGATEVDVSRSITEAAAGRLVPLIDRILPLSAVPDVHAQVEAGTLRPHGKIIFDPST